jgi:lipoprotein-releasing system permease protein
VADAAPFLVQEVLIAKGKRVAGGVVRGVALDSQVSSQVTVLDGAWPPTREVSLSVALGRDLAARLGASVGDTVALATFLSTDSGISFSLPRVKPFRICALLDLGVYQYNNSVCITQLSSAQEFYRMDDQATGIEIRASDPFEAEKIAAAITDSLGYPYYASSWQELNRPMFSMLALQKKALFLVLTLMVVVAAANVVSGLTALVSVRQREIGILMAMGVTRKGIASIFMASGWLLGSVGLAAGLVATVLLVAFANGSQLVHLAADVYQIDYLPLKLELPDILLVCATTFVISTVSTFLPSRRAGRLLPIEILRYE